MENNFKTDVVSLRARKSDVMYQVSLLQSLANGDYCGSVALEELKQHGDTGIGTFDRLNGELIMLDGEVYRAAGHGGVKNVSDDETVPFAVVAFMDADVTENLKEISDFDTLCSRLNRMVEKTGKNYFYMIRIDGRFKEMHVRSVYAQELPYRRLAEVLEQEQTFFDYENIEGTMVGVYCPPYLSQLNAAGWHMHFISNDKTKGGHVLGADITEAVLTWDVIQGFEMRLPQSELFSGFDLTVDQSEDIEKIEKNTPSRT